MYHTISDINKTIQLQRYIDNRQYDKKIGLKSFTYALGWYNIVNEYVQKSKQRPHHIQDGYYSLKQIEDVFESYNITLSASETNGIASLVTPNELTISKGLKQILGFENKRKFTISEINYGERTIDFALYKQLYVHLEQINSAYNFFDGAPSNILGVISVENKEYGDIVHKDFDNPKYKQLSGGTISELSISICDKNGNKINNNGLLIGCELEII